MREHLIAIISFIVVNALLLFSMYEFLNNIGFNGYNFFIAGVIFIFGNSVAFYLLISDALEEKSLLEKKLIDITKEMLHEINIPLATIKANIALLKRKAKDEKELKRLQRVALASNSLEKQHKKLSYLIKKEIMSIEKESVELKKLLEELIEDFKLISKHNFKLELQECKVLVDYLGLREVLINIISNAIKYSPASKPIIIRLHNCKIEIIDFGKGISANDLVFIYEKYYQGDSSIKGNGIGLHLVKAFCDKANIELQISSKENEYTKVELDFRKTALEEERRGKGVME